VKAIKIRNDRYELQIYQPYLGTVGFRLEANGSKGAHGIMIPIDDFTTPEQWLLELAEKWQARDAQGRLVYLYEDFIEFDEDDTTCSITPTLPLEYCGFTGDQVKEAILKELKPDDNPMPELKKGDVVALHCCRYPEVIQVSGMVPGGVDEVITINRQQPDGSLKEIWRRK
jgi:hypothetical protein